MTLAAAGDCTRSTQIPPTPMIDPVTSAGRCQIIVADQLATLGEIEFVDVRAQRGAQPLEGVRLLSLVQLADWPSNAKVTRVLLGTGLDDSSIADACRSTVARDSVVLRGGVRAWAKAFTHHTDVPTQLQRGLSTVSVAETLSSSAVLVVDLDRNPSLSTLLVAADIVFVDVQALDIDGSEPLVFVDENHWMSRFDQQTSSLSYYLQGGSDALVHELTRIRPDASSAGIALVRPCYFP
ncbi:MAG: hypothetical protein R3F15_11850 [Lysobacterales bacterium]